MPDSQGLQRVLYALIWRNFISIYEHKESARQNDRPPVGCAGNLQASSCYAFWTISGTEPLGMKYTMLPFWGAKKPKGTRTRLPLRSS